VIRALDAGKVVLVVFVAAILQVTILNAADIRGGAPDLLLVTLVSVALLRGAIAGALAGFFAGLLVDVATLQTLGLTSLVLTVAGYWIGRYGETTGRDRSHAPLLSVLVVTVLYAPGVYALDFVLGEAGYFRLVLASLPATVVFNLVLTVPIYALCRRLLRPPAIDPRLGEVRLLG
jgi:rod shape-determining protein MreD